MLNKAIETAELSDFVESLPDKLDTLISERGTNLSRGQSRELCWPRALALILRFCFWMTSLQGVDRKTKKVFSVTLKIIYPI